MKQQNIIIAGCGIGGLSAAIALAKAGHFVRILERTEQVRPVGAGISLQPNAMQALNELELAEQVMNRGCLSAHAQVRLSNGRFVRKLDFTRLQTDFGFLPMTIFRGDLIEVLCEAARSHGVVIQTGARVESFENGEATVDVTVKSGDTFSCDLLIGADGISSVIRTQLFGECPQRYSDYVCWRGIATEPDVVARVTEMNEIWGHGARFGFMKCSEDKVYWFATQTTAQPDNPPEDWADSFRSWPQPVTQLIESTPSDRIVFNDIRDFLPIDSWSEGRVTLLGDAAHAMTPNFGQGGAQAIEDSVVLSRTIAESDDLADALRRYETQRKPRTAWFVNGSFSFGKIGQGATWFRRLLRNQVMPRLPDSIVNRQFDRQFDFCGHLKNKG